MPDDWDQERNVQWSAEIPGGGWSSPVVSNGLIFLTTAVADGDVRPKGFGDGVQSMGSFFRSKAPDKPYSFEVHCLKADDGELIWRQSVLTQKPPFKIHPSNSYATESPVSDDQHVFAYFASVGVVACLDHQGNQVWKRDFGAYPTGNDFGTGSSLAIHDGRLFVQCDNEKESFVVALNAGTGDDLWRVERNGRTSWSSPVIWKNRARTELVTCGSDGVTSYDPKSGEQLWKLTGTGGAFSASPTFDQDRIYFGQSGRNSRGPLIAVNAKAEGELDLDTLREQAVAWVEDSAAPGMCSPVVCDGRVYVLSRGILSCHDAESGERIYRERMKDASSVTASLWASGDKVFALNEQGQTFVIHAGNEFKLAGSNSIQGLYWSTPSATETSLLIRSADKLHSIGK